MKIRKRAKSLSVCALLMAMVMLAATFAACGANAPSASSGSPSAAAGSEATQGNGLPIVKNPVTLSITVSKGTMDKKDFTQKEVFKKYEEQSNVKIKWNEILSTAWSEKMNLMINSGDLTDVIFGGALPKPVDAIDAGYIISLNDLIEKWSPSYKKFFQIHPEVLKAHSYTDGKLYWLPRYQDMEWEIKPDQQWINKSWLDKLGLKMPQTTDEFYQAMKAFKEKDPNGNGKADEIPLSLVGGAGYPFTSLFGSFGVLDPSGTHVMVKNKKVIFSPAEEGYYKALQYFSKLFAEGLLDKETFIQKAPELTSKGKALDALVGSFTNYVVDPIVGSERAKDYTYLNPLKGPDGTILWKRGTYIGSASAYITKVNKQPEVTMKWLEYIVVGENSLNTNLGPKDLTWIVLDDGKSYTQYDGKVPSGSSWDDLRATESSVGAPSLRVDEIVGMKFKLDDYTQRKMDAARAGIQYVEKEYFPPIPPFKQTDEDQNINLLQADLDNYVAKFLTESIIKGIDDTKWRVHLEQLKKMNVDKFIQYKQKQYDNITK